MNSDSVINRSYYENGNIMEIRYLMDGFYHSINGSSWIEYNEVGSLKMYGHHRYDNSFRIKGPAFFGDETFFWMMFDVEFANIDCSKF